MRQSILPLAFLVLAAAVGGCSGSQLRPPEVIKPVALTDIPGHSRLALDTAPKEEQRLVPPEAYLRTYIQIFGGPSALGVQDKARPGGLFDRWDDYFAALGFPDYKIDFPRGTQSNALMMATFERLGIALCDRAVEHDLMGRSLPPLTERRVFSFDLPKGGLDSAGFASRFDLLHKRFLGYPASLAPTDRTHRFYGLYNDITRLHTRRPAAGAPRSRFTPPQAAWAGVCYGLVRHPEFHLY